LDEVDVPLVHWRRWPISFIFWTISFAPKTSTRRDPARKPLKQDLIVILGKRGRLGRLQRQADRCFIAHEGQEVSGLELREWCWPRAVLIEGRPITEYERQSICRAARSIGAVKVRRTWLGDL